MPDPFADAESKKMQYRKWLETAARLQIRLTNWPAAVLPLGADFDIKKLNARHLDSLVNGYIENIKNHNEECVTLKIVRWSAGTGFCPLYLLVLS